MNSGQNSLSPKNKYKTAISSKHIEDIRYAKSLLENQSLAMGITNIVGKPIEKGISKLPDKVATLVNTATKKSIHASLKLATASMRQKNSSTSSNFIHKVASAASGAGGGFFGLTALPIELPLSTTIMLRSIMDIARSEGHNINSVEIELACIEVFALGGVGESSEVVDDGYFSTRMMLSNTLNEAAKHITNHGIRNESAPIIVQLISEISSRFGLQVSQKVLVQSLPIVSAASGLIINTLFIDHFQKIAKGHFIIRKMEKIYGEAKVYLEYNRIDLA